MFYLFVTNSLLTYGVTWYYERNKPGPVKMINPKTHGGVTSLAFISSFLALKPEHMIMGSKMAPFFIIPVTMIMYEVHEF